MVLFVAAAATIAFYLREALLGMGAVGRWGRCGGPHRRPTDNRPVRVLGIDYGARRIGLALSDATRDAGVALADDRAAPLRARDARIC